MSHEPGDRITVLHATYEFVRYGCGGMGGRACGRTHPIAVYHLNPKTGKRRFNMTVCIEDPERREVNDGHDERTT